MEAHGDNGAQRKGDELLWIMDGESNDEIKDRMKKTLLYTDEESVLRFRLMSMSYPLFLDTGMSLRPLMTGFWKGPEKLFKPYYVISDRLSGGSTTPQFWKDTIKKWSNDVHVPSYALLLTPAELFQKFREKYGAQIEPDTYSGPPRFPFLDGEVDPKSKLVFTHVVKAAPPPFLRNDAKTYEVSSKAGGTKYAKVHRSCIIVGNEIMPTQSEAGHFPLGLEGCLLRQPSVRMYTRLADTELQDFHVPLSSDQSFQRLWGLKAMIKERVHDERVAEDIAYFLVARAIESGRVYWLRPRAYGDDGHAKLYDITMRKKGQDDGNKKVLPDMIYEFSVVGLFLGMAEKRISAALQSLSPDCIPNPLDTLSLGYIRNAAKIFGACYSFMKNFSQAIVSKPTASLDTIGACWKDTLIFVAGMKSFCQLVFLEEGAQKSEPGSIAITDIERLDMMETLILGMECIQSPWNVKKQKQEKEKDDNPCLTLFLYAGLRTFYIFMRPSSNDSDPQCFLKGIYMAYRVVDTFATIIKGGDMVLKSVVALCAAFRVLGFYHATVAFENEAGGLGQCLSDPSLLYSPDQALLALDAKWASYCTASNWSTSYDMVGEANMMAMACNNLAVIFSSGHDHTNMVLELLDVVLQETRAIYKNIVTRILSVNHLVVDAVKELRLLGTFAACFLLSHLTDLEKFTNFFVDEDRLKKLWICLGSFCYYLGKPCDEFGFAFGGHCLVVIEDMFLRVMERRIQGVHDKLLAEAVDSYFGLLSYCEATADVLLQVGLQAKNLVFFEMAEKLLVPGVLSLAMMKLNYFLNIESEGEEAGSSRPNVQHSEDNAKQRLYSHMRDINDEEILWRTQFKHSLCIFMYYSCRFSDPDFVEARCMSNTPNLSPKEVSSLVQIFRDTGKAMMGSSMSPPMAQEMMTLVGIARKICGEKPLLNAVKGKTLISGVEQIFCNVIMQIWLGCALFNFASCCNILALMKDLARLSEISLDSKNGVSLGKAFGSRVVQGDGGEKKEVGKPLMTRALLHSLAYEKLRVEEANKLFGKVLISGFVQQRTENAEAGISVASNVKSGSKVKNLAMVGHVKQPNGGTEGEPFYDKGDKLGFVTPRDMLKLTMPIVRDLLKSCLKFLATRTEARKKGAELHLYPDCEVCDRLPEGIKSLYLKSLQLDVTVGDPGTLQKGLHDLAMEAEWQLTDLECQWNIPGHCTLRCKDRKEAGKMMFQNMRMADCRVATNVEYWMGGPKVPTRLMVEPKTAPKVQKRRERSEKAHEGEKKRRRSSSRG